MADLMKAIRAAHDAGDEDGARRLVAMYQSQQQPQQAVQPEKNPVSRFISGIGGEVLKAGGAAGDAYNAVVGQKHDMLGDYVRQGAEQGIKDATTANDANEFTAGDVGKFIGAAAPYVAMPTISIPKMMAQTALFTSGDIGERAKAAALTGAIGGGMRGIGGFTPSKEAAEYLSRGIVPSVGQGISQEGLAGRLVRKLEEGSKSTLGIGQAAEYARNRASNEWLSSVMKNAELPSAGISADGKLGYEGLQNLKGGFDKNYKQLLKDQNINVGDDFGEMVKSHVSANPSNEPIINRELGILGEPQFKEIKGTATPWHKQPIDTEKDNMLAAITKLGGLNKDMAQKTYGNRMWEDVNLGLNTFRNEGGHSLDDMATLLSEKGYLPEGSGVYELTEKLYGNAKDTYSVSKSGYGHMDLPQSAQDQLHSQLSDLITALNSKNAPKPKAEKSYFNGETSAQKLHDIAGALRDKGATYKRSMSAAEKYQGEDLTNASYSVRDYLDKMLPGDLAKTLKEVDAKYGAYKTLESAAADLAAVDGKFNGYQLMKAIKRSDQTKGKGAFGRGEARLQAEAEAARKVFGDTLGESGTTPRAIVAEALKGNAPLVAAGAINPAALALIPAGILGSARPMQKALLSGYKNQKAISEALLKLSPIAGESLYNLN
jgi:hypothetical protein